MQIPVFDLTRQFQAVKNEIAQGVKEVLSSGNYVLGKNVCAFEDEFARYCGTKYAVGVASGTDALKIALRACGIGRGAEVITTPFTFVAASEAVLGVGAKVVFADIDLDSYAIDPREIEKKITEKTGAILCVHLYGQPCDMQAIRKLARKYKLKLIEDCAQSAGADCQGRKTGAFGDAGCFSFYPTKNLGAFGDGGMLTTNTKEVAEYAKILRAHGSKVKYRHIIHGYNSRLDELQAAILRKKLKFLDKWNNARREIAACYNERFLPLEEEGHIARPKELKGTNHIYHLYTLRAKKRDSLIKFLTSKGISTALHYPVPIHLQKAYEAMKWNRGDFPRAEQAADEVVSLPLYPELAKKEIKYITDTVYEFFRR